MIPLDLGEPVKITILEDDVERTSNTIVKKDKLLMFKMTQNLKNLMKTYTLSSQPVETREQKLYLEPAAGSSDEKLIAFSEIIKKSPVHIQPKFDMNNTHLVCAIEKSVYPATKNMYCLFAVSLYAVLSPAVHFVKLPEKCSYAKTRIVTCLHSGHIASIQIWHSCQTVNMVTFMNGMFQEVYRVKHMPSIKLAFETNKLYDTNPNGITTLIFDGASQRIKVYYRQRDDARKMNIRVKALKIIV